MTDESLPDLPDVPSDFCEMEGRPPTWREQLAHAQLLLSWRKAQGLPVEHPPRHAEPFVMP